MYVEWLSTALPAQRNTLNHVAPSLAGPSTGS